MVTQRQKFMPVSWSISLKYRTDSNPQAIGDFAFCKNNYFLEIAGSFVIFIVERLWQITFGHLISGRFASGG